MIVSRVKLVTASNMIQYEIIFYSLGPIAQSLCQPVANISPESCRKPICFSSMLVIVTRYWNEMLQSVRVALRSMTRAGMRRFALRRVRGIFYIHPNAWIWPSEYVGRCNALDL